MNTFDRRWFPIWQTVMIIAPAGSPSMRWVQDVDPCKRAKFWNEEINLHKRTD